MAGIRDPYRTNATTCDMCGATMTSERLTTFCSLQTCEPCRTGKIENATKHWGFEVETRGSRDICIVEVKRRRPFDIVAKFRAESFISKISKLLGDRDMEVGDEIFDKAVLVGVDDEYTSSVAAVCQLQGAQEAIMRILVLGKRVHNSVDLANSLVGGLVEWEDFQEHVGESELWSAVTALAIIVEEFVRTTELSRA